MKFSYSLFRAALFLLLLQLSAGVCQTMAATVGFTVTPSAVSNTYGGTITLQVTSLTSGQTVLVQKFIDLNTNGVIDGADLLWQQFQLTDGQASVIGGITNVNVPGDSDMTAGQITARLLFRTDSPGLSFIGKYAYRLSSPTGLFSPITNFFSITNTSYGQSFTGNVVSNGTNVPNALVLLFRPGDWPLGGTVADNSGAYSIKMPAGTYALTAFKSNYLGNLAAKPVTLADGATMVTNIVMSNATQTVSGKLVDAADSSIGLPGLLLHSSAEETLAGIGTSQTNGNFSIRVATGKLDFGASGAEELGYLNIDSDYLSVDTTMGSVTGLVIRYPKATGLFYGCVKDDQGQPLAGVFVASHDYNDIYKSQTLTDTNGYYVVGALDDGPWEVEVADKDQPIVTNYIFSEGLYGTNVGPGEAVPYDFTALLATNHITGHVQDANGKPITNVTVYAFADIGGNSYETDLRTDTNGNYSLHVANGNWDVGVWCGSEFWNPADCCPFDQNVVIASTNAVVNFTAPGKIVVTTPRQLPAAFLGEFYLVQLEASDCGQFLNWSSTNLPSWLDLSLDGYLTGSPDTAGTYNFCAEVHNEYGRPISKAFSVVVRSGLADVQAYGVEKLRAYHQTGPANPVLDGAPGPYFGYLTIGQNEPGLISSATCTLPTSVIKMFPPADNEMVIEVHDSFTTQSAFDAAYPAGNYSFAMHTLNDGDQFPILTMPASAYPNAPHISNFAAAQAIDPDLDFALQFDPFSEGTNDDWIWLVIAETNGTPVFNTATSWRETELLIPSGVFEFGKLYVASIAFQRILTEDFESYAGVFGGTTAAAQTSFPIATVSGGPILSQPTKTSATQFRFLVTGIAMQNYIIEKSTNISSTNWSALFVTNAPADSFFVVDPSATNGRAFYRAVLGP
jgi:hypothetical protein